MSKKAFKYYTICIDGMDKTGKDLLMQYLIRMSNYKYIINARGIITQIAYNDLFKRGDEYDFEQQKDIVNVFLTVCQEDWNMRCRITKEPKIDYYDNLLAFERAAKEAKQKGCIVFEYDTSKMTPYAIAKDVIEKVDKMNEEFTNI